MPKGIFGGRKPRIKASDDEIVAVIRSGVTAGEIIDTYSVNSLRLAEIRRRAGIKKLNRKPRGYRGHIYEDEIISMLQSGSSMYEIHKACGGVNHKTIEKIMAIRGVTEYKHGSRRKEADAEKHRKREEKIEKTKYRNKIKQKRKQESSLRMLEKVAALNKKMREIHQMRNNGYTLQQIGTKYGCTMQNIQGLISRDIKLQSKEK